MTPSKKKFWNIPSGIWALGIIGFLINAATIMVFSELPVFMERELGLSRRLITEIDGFVESIAHITRIFSGALSDVLQKRKLVLGIGYALTTLAKPLFAVAYVTFQVIAVRILDRFSNGIQAAPRDALIGDLAPKTRRGASYGLARSLRAAGSVVGSVFAIYIMSMTEGNFRLLFAIASIPAFIGFSLLIFGVREPKHRDQFHLAVSPNKKKSTKDRLRALVIRIGTIAKRQFIKSGKDKSSVWAYPFYWTKGLYIEFLGGLPRSYWKIILLVVVYHVAHFGESILSFRAQNVDTPVEYLPLVMGIFNIGQFAISFPLGYLSDRFKRRNILCVGFVLAILSNFFLGYGTTPFLVGVGVVLWGAQTGVAQSILVSMVSDQTPQHLRGIAFGLMYFVMGLMAIVANMIAGRFWENPETSQYTFIFSACFTLISILLLFVLAPKKKGIEQ